MKNLKNAKSGDKFKTSSGRYAFLLGCFEGKEETIYEFFVYVDADAEYEDGKPHLGNDIDCLKQLYTDCNGKNISKNKTELNEDIKLN